MAELGRKKLPLDQKIIAIPCNCYLTSVQIEKLGGRSSVRQLFQDAGNKEIEHLLFLKSKVE